jgi:hypothetical protein
VRRLLPAHVDDHDVVPRALRAEQLAAVRDVEVVAPPDRKVSGRL